MGLLTLFKSIQILAVVLAVVYFGWNIDRNDSGFCVKLVLLESCSDFRNLLCSSTQFVGWSRETGTGGIWSYGGPLSALLISLMVLNVVSLYGFCLFLYSFLLSPPPPLPHIHKDKNFSSSMFEKVAVLRPEPTASCVIFKFTLLWGSLSLDFTVFETRFPRKELKFYKNEQLLNW